MNKTESGFFLVLVALVAMTAVFAKVGWSHYGARESAIRWKLDGCADHAVKVLEEPLERQDFQAVEQFKAACRREGIDCVVRKSEREVYGDIPGWGVRRDCGDYRIELHVNGIARFQSFLGWTALELLALLLGIFGAVRMYRARSAGK